MPSTMSLVDSSTLAERIRSHREAIAALTDDDLQAEEKEWPTTRISTQTG